MGEKKADLEKLQRDSGCPDAFSSDYYQNHNRKRFEHLASLNLIRAGSTVLEVGAGIGDHTAFLLDNGLKVTSTDARQMNLDVLRSEYPDVDAQILNMDCPPPGYNGKFDIVYCYGLLYHLKEPSTAIKFMSNISTKLLLLETRVSFGDEESLNPVFEDRAYLGTAASGVGCRPTRKWVYNQLKLHYEFVYLPATQPDHEEFPLDWNLPEYEQIKTQNGPRAVFIASRQKIESDFLLNKIPMRQTSVKQN